MNRNQISKILNYLFVKNAYGVKEINKNEIWLLKDVDDYPIVCVILNPQKDANYYMQKHAHYQQILGKQQQLVLINVPKKLASTFINEQARANELLAPLLNDDFYYNDYQDNTLALMQLNFTNQKQVFPWITCFIALISLMCYFLSTFDYGSELSFLMIGYYNTAIIYLEEGYRLFTNIFYSSDLVPLIFYVYYLLVFEKVYTLKYSKTYFAWKVISVAIFSNITMSAMNVELIPNGLISVISYFVVYNIIETFIVRYKYPQRVRLNYNTLFLDSFVLIFCGYDHLESLIVGSLIACLSIVYSLVKTDLFAKSNYYVAIIILILGLASTNNYSLNTDNIAYQKLKTYKSEVQSLDLQQKIITLEQLYER